MSLDIALKFITAATTDSALKEKLKTVGTNIDALIAIAQSAGYQFSIDDFNSATKKFEEMRLRGELPLADSDLDSISGGTGTQFLSTNTCSHC